MNEWTAVGIDLVAIVLLTFGVYFPRYHRRDLVAAFLGVNVAVLAVSLTLTSTTVGVGLGLGLFGVLSIIRLRSYEIEQHEIAYYFAALALGLLSGLSGTANALNGALTALVIAALFLGDHPKLFRRYRRQTTRLDSAYTDEDALRAYLEILLNGRVVYLSIKHVDLVNDTTVVEVRYVASPAQMRCESSPTVDRVTTA